MRSLPKILLGVPATLIAGFKPARGQDAIARSGDPRAFAQAHNKVLEMLNTFSS